MPLLWLLRDQLNITGTVLADQFLFRANANPYGLDFVALLKHSNDTDHVERVNYSHVEALNVFGSSGNDRFAVDDVRDGIAPPCD